MEPDSIISVLNRIARKREEFELDFEDVTLDLVECDAKLSGNLKVRFEEK